jgi:hypothetical protein
MTIAQYICISYPAMSISPGREQNRGRRRHREDKVVKVKSSQKIFTDSEVASLTGICVDHLHNFARSRHLGFIARAAEAAGAQADQWLFTLSDLMVLTTLFPRCTH